MSGECALVLKYPQRFDMKKTGSQGAFRRMKQLLTDHGEYRHKNLKSLQRIGLQLVIEYSTDYSDD